MEQSNCAHKFGKLATGGTGRERPRCAGSINSVLATKHENFLTGSVSRNTPRTPACRVRTQSHQPGPDYYAQSGQSDDLAIRRLRTRLHIAAVCT